MAKQPHDLIEIVNKESKKGVQKMINNHAVDNRKVLVELSLIPMNGKNHLNDEIPFAADIANSTDLAFEQAHNTICMEGEWNKISEVIYKCYDRIQAQFPQGFLQVSIR